MTAENEKTFTETEHVAILSDRVAKETADLTAKVETLESQVSELQSKLDIAESAKVAAEQAAADEKAAHEAFKTEVDEREQAAARKGDRLKKAKEVASHLGEGFFDEESRVARIVAMSDETFESYIGDLAATAPASPASTTAVPRETAMAGATAATPSTTTAARGFLFAGRLPATTQEG